MNPGDTGRPPAVTYPPAKKSFPIVPVVLGFTGLIVVLVAIGVSFALHAAKDNSSEAIIVASSFIDNMGQHNYKAARTLFVPEVQARATVSGLKDIETLVEKRHGAFINHGEPQWNVQSWNGKTSVRLAYPARFTSSVCAVSLLMVKTGGSYQVYDVRYEF